MDNIPDIINSTGGTVGIVAVVGAIAYAVGSALNGLNQAERNLIKTLKSHLTALEKRDLEQQQELDSQKDEIGRLLNEKKEEEKKMQVLIEVLQNRNPELESHLDDIGNKLTMVVRMLSDHVRNYKNVDNQEVEVSHTKVTQAS